MSTASQHFPSSTVKAFAMTNYMYIYFQFFFRYVFIEICVVLFKPDQLHLIQGFCITNDLIETMFSFLHLRQISYFHGGGGGFHFRLQCNIVLVFLILSSMRIRVAMCNIHADMDDVHLHNCITF